MRDVTVGRLGRWPPPVGVASAWRRREKTANSNSGTIIKFDGRACVCIYGAYL